MHTTTTSLAAAALFGTMAHAQQGLTESEVPRIDTVVPLKEYVSQPEEAQVPYYPLQRCAGLFLGLQYYSGATMTSEQAAVVERNTEIMRVSAIFLELARAAQQRGHRLEELPETFFQSIPEASALQMEAFALFYRDRMQDNFQTQGTAFSQDVLIDGDLTVCQQYVPIAEDLAERMGR